MKTKFFILILLLLPGLIFAQSTEELESEIKKLLIEKYGAKKSITISTIGGGSNPSREDYYIFLKNFREILKDIENAAVLKKINEIRVVDMPYDFKYKYKQNGSFRIEISSKKPPEAFLILLSSDFKNESIYSKYQKYLEKGKYFHEIALKSRASAKNKEKNEEEKENETRKKLEKALGRWDRYNKVGEQLLCNFGINNAKQKWLGLAWDTSELQAEIERLLGQSIEKVEYSSDVDQKSGDRKIKVIIHLASSPPPSRIVLTEAYESNEKYPYSSNVIIDNGQSVSGVSALAGVQFHSKFTHVAYNQPNCKPKKVTRWFYDQGKLSSKIRYDKKLNVISSQYKNREVFSLKEIYGSCVGTKRSFDEVYQLSKRVDRVLVTILDTGIDYNHPEIAYKIPNRAVDRSHRRMIEKKQMSLMRQRIHIEDQMKKKNIVSRAISAKDFEKRKVKINDMIRKFSIGWDYNEGENQPYDSAFVSYWDSSFGIEFQSHGTHVAGIASRGSDDITILPLRHPDLESSQGFYKAIEFAYRRGSRIVNISLGNSSSTRWHSLKKAMDDFPDMLFVASAGNEKNDNDIRPHYPSSFDNQNMLVVASVDDKNNLSVWSEKTGSNWGKIGVDVAAPGDEILSIFPENTEEKASGTSMAAPFVTRICAKIKFINPKLSSRQIIAIVRDSVTPVESLRFKVKYGGVVNEEKALELARKTVKNSEE